MAEVQDGAAAPVVTATEVVEHKPAPAAEEQKAEEVSDKPEETTEQAEERRKQKEREHNQRRLQRRTTEAAEAKAEAKLLREDRDRLRTQLDEKAKQQQGSDEPKREQFEDYESYLRALAKYDAKQETASTLKADREARESKEQQGKQKEVSEKVAKNWTEREAAFQAATKDYASVVESFVEEDLSTLSYQARHAILESEVGPALLYHLATHPDVAERIADLSPTRQIVELGKLEEKLPVAKKTTNAPAPISPVSGGKTSSKDPSKMSQKEYEAYRKSQGARWAS